MTNGTGEQPQGWQIYFRRADYTGEEMYLTDYGEGYQLPRSKGGTVFPTKRQADILHATTFINNSDNATTFFAVVLALGEAPPPLPWQHRELGRFRDGTYQDVPWSDQEFTSRHPEHFTHISTEQEGKIAFTENAKRGEADRQLVMSPGRYLNRFYGDVLDNTTIEQWCAKLSVAIGENALKVTQDADEIEAVYVGGPNSCMSGAASRYSGHCHPSRVYAGPDLAIAYIGAQDDASARCVVWPDRKVYGRVYGDTSRLKLLLEGAGYSAGSIEGARVRKIENECSGGGFIMPYVDNISGAEVDGDYIKLGDGGLETSNQHGLTDAEARWVCPRCEGHEDEDDSSYISDVEESWCAHCTSNHTTRCEHDYNSYSDSRSTFTTVYGWHGSEYTILDENLEAFGAVYVEDEGEYYREDMTGWCEVTEREHLKSNLVQLDDGRTVCQSAADEIAEEAAASAEEDADTSEPALAA